MTWRAPTRDDRTVAWLWACCAALVVALRGVWITLAPFVPACPWRRITGFACPGCGTTRAALRVLRFDLAGALALNPLAAAGLVAFLACGFAAPLWIALRRPVPEPSPGPKPGWAVAAAAAVGINWAWLVAAGV